ncbi:MAG TPA: UdgX family uracil-DNA binding protein, partial [Acidimicrobiia bacterium]|nr:UdgX family uracil-DNA binding protein [Acidimicrobiia bacterium]
AAPAGYANGVTVVDELRDEAARCTACDLYKDATQVVFGEGPPDADLMLMGEVPGDKEDLAGHTFVGPAGHVLDDALGEIGLDRTQIYLTNAVKHFKFEQRGKVRIHKTPNRTEQIACSRWWQAELDAVHPKVIGLLGAVAGQAVLGPKYRVTKQRGEWIQLKNGVWALGTVHPSSILRAQERRAEEYAAFVRDLQKLTERV